MLTALVFLVIVVVLCLGVAFLDRKMVLAMSFDSTPSNTLTLRQRIPESGSLLAQRLAFPADVLNGSSAAMNPNDGTKTDNPGDKSVTSLQQAGPVRRQPRTPNNPSQTDNKLTTTTTISTTTTSDAYASTIPTTPEPRVSKYYDPPPFRLIQDDVSGKFDKNRWEVTHIVRNDSLRKKLEIVDGLRNQEGTVVMPYQHEPFGILNLSIRAINVCYQYITYQHELSMHPLPATPHLPSQHPYSCPVAVFITSTGAKHGVYLRDRVMPSSRYCHYSQSFLCPIS